MISTTHQMAILADIELNFKEEMLNGNWKEFFEENNVGFPLSTMITLDLAELPSNAEKRFYAETLVRQTFVNLCKELNLDHEHKFTSAGKMFEMSDNPPISEKEQEDL